MAVAAAVEPVAAMLAAAGFEWGDAGVAVAVHAIESLPAPA